MSRKIMLIACVSAALVAVVVGQSFSQDTCQKATQGASSKIVSAVRDEVSKFQRKLSKLAQGSLNTDQINDQVDQISQSLQSLLDSSSSGNIDLQHLTDATTQVSSQSIQLGSSLFNARAPLAAYSAYFQFLFGIGQQLQSVMSEVQQACVPSQ